MYEQVMWGPSDLDLSTFDHHILMSSSLSGCLCQIWKNNLKVVLKYHIQENRTDGKHMVAECKKSRPKCPKASSHCLFCWTTIQNTGYMINTNRKQLFIIHNMYELSSFIYYYFWLYYIDLFYDNWLDD